MLKKISPYRVKKAILYLKHYGPKAFWVRVKERLQTNDIDYKEWYQKHKPSMEQLQVQRETVFEKQPLISIVVPVFHTPELFLRQMVQSVLDQTYSHWELCIANASPDNQEVRGVLDEFASKDSRIKTTDVHENAGIAQNTNAALSIATGEYVGFLDHDDLLSPDALFEMVKAINQLEETQLLYSDEDKVADDMSEHFQPHMKPDFNLDLLRSNNYICHFLLINRQLIEQVGGLRGEFNGAQDYDLIFRCAESAENIVHIPKVLYHWRVHRESTSDNPLSKKYAFDAGKRAIEEHLERCGEEAVVYHTKDMGFYRVEYKMQDSPLISIIIPNKDQTEVLDKCLKSIERSTYQNYEIIIIENNSEEKRTFEYYDQIQSAKIRVVRWDREFNYSVINNWGVQYAKGEYLLFLNNDVEVITSDWLERLAANCQRKDIGITGAKLYYPDNRIQHAGIIVGLGGVAGNAFTGLPGEYTGYMHKASIQQKLSAVTGACMMVKRRAGGGI